MGPAVAVRVSTALAVVVASGCAESGVRARAANVAPARIPAPPVTEQRLPTHETEVVRRGVTPHRIGLPDLHILVVPDVLDGVLAPDSLDRADSEAASMELGDLPLGEVWMDGYRAWIPGARPNDFPGVALRGRRGGVEAVRWQGPRAAPAGRGIEYWLVDGWFDARLWRTSAVRRTRVTTQEVVPELVYAYGECVTTTCARASTVTLLLPRAVELETTGMADAGTFTRIRLPWDRWATRSAAVRLDRAGRCEWRAALFGETACRASAHDVIVRVELTRSVADARTTAVAYVELQPSAPP